MESVVPKSTLEVAGSSVLQVIVAVPSKLGVATTFDITGGIVSTP